MYVLVLGLDVLGNPYALIHGIGEGVRDFFYEPYQVRWLRLDFFFSENLSREKSHINTPQNPATVTNAKNCQHLSLQRKYINYGLSLLPFLL